MAGASTFKASPIDARCELVASNFFEEVPTGGDLYVLKNVLHDWSDEDALKILKNCRRVMSSKHRLVVIDIVLGPSNEPDPGRWSDIEMMMLLGGRERGAADFTKLLRAADFEITKVLPTGESGLFVSVIEARPL